MNKKSILIFICCIYMSVSLLTLTGCLEKDSKDAEKTAVCFVIGNHANSMGLNMNSPLVRDTVYSIVKHEGTLGVVVADGKPEVIHCASYDLDPRLKTASTKQREQYMRAKADNILSSLESVEAKHPECDYWAALRLAEKMLSSLEGYDSKHVIVLGTGLSTTGLVNFNNNLILAEPETIVELLNKKSEIPDFSGISVYWQQLADVAPPQKELTAEQKIKLEKIYSGIIEAGGGSFICKDIIANPVNDATNYPTVTPVKLPDDTPIYFDPDDEFEEEQVTFMENKADYLHPDEAAKTLRPIAEYLLQHPSVNILLAGTTAGDTASDFTITLSQARADVTKHTLITLGVAENRIIAIGLSCNNPWHVRGLGEGAAASGNRKVVLLDASSKTAISILNQHQQTP